MTAINLKRSLRAHWFFVAAAIIAASDFTAVSLGSGSSPELLEAGVLFDLSVVIPALYLWCYRSRGKAAVLRAVALGCLGIWIAGHLIPNEHHHILSVVGFVRYIGLAVLLVIEIKLAAMIFRSAFSRDREAKPSVLATAKDAGMPEWAARLMAWEASLWRRAWDWLQRRISRN